MKRKFVLSLQACSCFGKTCFITIILRNKGSEYIEQTGVNNFQTLVCLNFIFSLELQRKPLYICSSSLYPYQERQRVMADEALTTYPDFIGKGYQFHHAVGVTDKSDPQQLYPQSILKAHLIYRVSFYLQ